MTIHRVHFGVGETDVCRCECESMTASRSAASRRFKKLLEGSGLQKELRKRKHYEKPCELRRRAKLRKLAAIRKAKVRNPNA